MPVMNRKFFALASLLFCNLSMAAHPVPDSPMWLNYPAVDGPGKGKLIVLITADQEYRSEQSLPMLAGILSKHYGFDCTVLFGVNEAGLVDPTAPVYPEKGKESEFKAHNIPGLEHLAKADMMIFATRLQTLPEEQMKAFAAYFDSGKPFMSLRTGNHGFRSPLPYVIDGKKVTLTEILGGTFLGHHGNWSADSTRGDIIPEQKDHPLLKGVKDIWGLTDVYRTYREGESLPAGCTALVMGQPLIGRVQGGESNPKKEPLPVVWVKDWKTSQGKAARVIHCTMGSAKDLENPGLRRLVVNGAFWGLAMEDQIQTDRSVEPISEYKPLSSGFNYEKLGVRPQPVSSFR
jgi:type 1 glutamine amidotransferase